MHSLKPAQIIPLLALTGLLILFIVTTVSFAAVSADGTTVPDKPEEIIKVIAKVGRWMFTAFFVVAIICIIIAAFNFLTAQGDVEKVKNARNQILWAAVAIAIALISTGVVEIVKTIIKP